MTRLPFASLRSRLILLVFLAVIPALGMMLYTAAEGRQKAATQAQQEALRLARLAANEQEHLVEGAYQLLIALARLPEVRSGDLSACSALFADLMAQYRRYTNFVVTEPDGDVFCSSQPLTGPVNFADRAWFQQAVETRDFTIGEYLIGRITGRALVVFAYPILDAAGQVQAVVSAGLDLAWLNELVAEAQLPPGSTFTVTDRNGTILARHPDPEKWVGQTMPESSIVKTILTQQAEGVAEAAGVDGVTRLYAFNGFEPEIRHAVDPKWRNITPYVVLLDRQGREQRVIGPPDAARLKAWLA